ncbi:hypothetical protein [Halobaculum sp. EA56]|uniref:hypothetical protein n=1 Tax=Halobaculum sp. EA56 TaxID=3421648 RepID=UPI003EB9776B
MSSEAEPDGGTASNGEEGRDWSRGEPTGSRSAMLARTWAIAGCYGEPAEYGIPDLPGWEVRRVEDGGLSFVAEGETRPFISAEDPVRVRR